MGHWKQHSKTETDKPRQNKRGSAVEARLRSRAIKMEFWSANESDALMLLSFLTIFLALTICSQKRTNHVHHLNIGFCLPYCRSSDKGRPSWSNRSESLLARGTADTSHKHIYISIPISFWHRCYIIWTDYLEWRLNI